MSNNINKKINKKWNEVFLPFVSDENRFWSLLYKFEAIAEQDGFKEVNVGLSALWETFDEVGLSPYGNKVLYDLLVKFKEWLIDNEYISDCKSDICTFYGE